jgi:hypothetical protein
MRHHDKYDDGRFVDPTGRYVPAKAIHRRTEGGDCNGSLVVESPTRSAAVRHRGTP